MAAKNKTLRVRICPVQSAADLTPEVQGEILDAITVAADPGVTRKDLVSQVAHVLATHDVGIKEIDAKLASLRKARRVAYTDMEVRRIDAEILASQGERAHAERNRAEHIVDEVRRLHGLEPLANGLLTTTANWPVLVPSAA